MKDSEILEEARKRFKQAYDAESKNRELALDDIKFRNGDQWDEAVKSQRQAENRPCLTINKLEQRVDQVTGDQRMNRMGPVIRPLNVTESNGGFTIAKIYDGIIRNIESVSNAKTAYDTAFDHAAGHGFGFVRIITEYNDDDSFDQDIKIKRLANCFRVYLDPSAEEQTKKDAMWGFITSFVDKDDYPGGDWVKPQGEGSELWYETDKIRIAEYFRRVPMEIEIWLLPDGKSVRVKDDSKDVRDELTEQGIVPKKTRKATTYKVEWYKLGYNEVFEKKEFPSKYIPIVPFYGKELNVDGETIYRGVIRFAKDPQRIYNYTRTASVEQVSLAPKAPWVIEETQIGNHAKLWETANVKNHPMLVYKNKTGVPPPMRQAPPQPSAGWMSESALADQDIDSASGMYKASLGAPSNERSGKAINARKVEGDVGVYHFHDNKAMSLQHVYEILVDMIPRVYDTDRIVRIKTPEEKEEMVQINQTVFDNESGQWVKIYDLSQGKYDVSVDIGASYTTQRQMASESMMELIQYAPQLAPRILDLIAKNLDWPGAEDIASRLKENPPTEEQIKQAIDQAVQEALNNQDFKLKFYEAQTKRMSALGKVKTDDDNVEIELLKLLDENGVTDQEIQSRAIEILRQISEPQAPMGQAGTNPQSEGMIGA
jgi:hypothetical protein